VVTTEKTYEMLWDCRYCSQKKLLGLTHRFCAGCGAPQDATKRYFPKEHEKVAVQDHPYAGADVQCPACNAWNSRRAAHCTHCGGPLTTGKQAPLRVEPGIVPSGQPSAKKDTSPLVWVLVVTLVGVVGLVMVLAFWKRGGAFEVTGRTWERSIEIERFGPVRDSAWCDQLPNGARVVSRHQEPRSTKKTPDGQTCTKKKKDNGDGTYKEITECSPKYKEEPVMGEKCDIDVDQWKPARTVSATGVAKDEPKWPLLEVKQRGACIGCEREGKRKESYGVALREATSGKESRCSFDNAARWGAFKDGARFEGKIAVVTGSLDCDSLHPK